MNDLLFDTMSPSYWGWPYHGFIAQKSDYTWTYFVDGVERPLPFTRGATPYGRRISFAVKHPDAPPLLSPADIATERLAGRVWSDKAWLAGTNNTVYCQGSAGQRSWIAILPDGQAWTVSIQSGNEWPAGWTWRMVFHRYNSGPLAIGDNPSGFRYFSIKISPVPDSTMFSATQAQADYQGLQDYYTISDVHLNGQEVLVHERADGTKVIAALRIPTAAEFDGFGIDLATAAGAMDVSFSPVIDWENTGVVDEIIPRWPSGSLLVNRYQRTPVFSFLFEVDSTTRERITSGTFAAPEIVIDSGGNTWHVWSELPPHECVFKSTLTRKAHFSEDGLGFVLYQSVRTITVKWELVGGSISKVVEYGSGSLVEPAVATIRKIERVDHTVSYGDSSWSGSHEVVTNDAFASNHPLVYGLRFESRIPCLGAVPLTSEQIFSFCPVADDAVFDFNTPSGVPITFGMSNEFVSPAMFMTAITEPSVLHNLPAIQSIPLGLYYKGRFVSSFLPTSTTIWALDPETDEILQLPASSYRSAFKV